MYLPRWEAAAEEVVVVVVVATREDVGGSAGLVVTAEAGWPVVCVGVVVEVGVRA